MYLAVRGQATSAVLVQQLTGRQVPIYFVSRVMQDADTRYSAVEKLVLSLVTAIRRLRPYFQAHPICVFTNLPLKPSSANPKHRE